MGNILTGIMETVPVVETVPDKDEEKEINHGTPVDHDNDTNNDAGNEASLDDKEELDPCILCQMKRLGGWFNPTAK